MRNLLREVSAMLFDSKYIFVRVRKMKHRASTGILNEGEFFLKIKKKC